MAASRLALLAKYPFFFEEPFFDRRRRLLECFFLPSSPCVAMYPSARSRLALEEKYFFREPERLRCIRWTLREPLRLAERLRLLDLAIF